MLKSIPDRSFFSDKFLSGEILVKPNRTVLVGRDEANNDVVFLNPIVSGCQFEIYSLIVDEEDDHPPIVFIRDRGSANGTCVNGQLIGKRPMVCQGRVLDDGDIITVGGRPDLTFTYTQVQPVRSSYTLSPVQRKEVKVRSPPTSSVAFRFNVPRSSKIGSSSMSVQLGTAATLWFSWPGTSN